MVILDDIMIAILQGSSSLSWALQLGLSPLLEKRKEITSLALHMSRYLLLSESSPNTNTKTSFDRFSH